MDYYLKYYDLFWVAFFVKHLYNVPLQWRIQSYFGQTGTHIEPTKVPRWLAPSGVIFKIFASRYFKNGIPGSANP